MLVVRITVTSRMNVDDRGLLDEIFLESAIIEIVRSGIASYDIIVAADPKMRFVMWTTDKARVEFIPWPDAQPAWVVLEHADATLQRLATTAACGIHLEHVDRDGYALSFARDGVSWGGALRASGYLKVRREPSASD